MIKEKQEHIERRSKPEIPLPHLARDGEEPLGRRKERSIWGHLQATQARTNRPNTAEKHSAGLRRHWHRSIKQQAKDRRQELGAVRALKQWRECCCAAMKGAKKKSNWNGRYQSPSRFRLLRFWCNLVNLDRWSDASVPCYCYTWLRLGPSK